jgi:hypothetical protein
MKDYMVFGEIIVYLYRFKLNKTSTIICKYQIWSVFNLFIYFKLKSFSFHDFMFND